MACPKFKACATPLYVNCFRPAHCWSDNSLYVCFTHDIDVCHNCGEPSEYDECLDCLKLREQLADWGIQSKASLKILNSVWG